MPFKLEELELANAEIDLLDCVDRVLASPPPTTDFKSRDPLLLIATLKARTPPKPYGLSDRARLLAVALILLESELPVIRASGWIGRPTRLLYLFISSPFLRCMLLHQEN